MTDHIYLGLLRKIHKFPQVPQSITLCQTREIRVWQTMLENAGNFVFHIQIQSLQECLSSENAFNLDKSGNFCLSNPFPNNKFSILPDSKSLQTTILFLIKKWEKFLQKSGKHWEKEK